MDTEKLLSQIHQADGAALDDIAKALTDRYNTLFPDHEILYLALPKDDPKERKRLLKLIQKMV